MARDDHSLLNRKSPTPPQTPASSHLSFLHRSIKSMESRQPLTSMSGRLSLCWLSRYWHGVSKDYAT